MLTPITSRFKDSWKVTVTVISSGFDRWGNPLPGSTTRTIADCLFSPTSSTEGQDLSQVPDDRAKLLTPPGETIPAKARIKVPGHGTWDVAGTPNTWPLGTSVQLTQREAPDGP